MAFGNRLWRRITIHLFFNSFKNIVDVSIEGINAEDWGRSISSLLLSNWSYHRTHCESLTWWERVIFETYLSIYFALDAKQNQSKKVTFFSLSLSYTHTHTETHVHTLTRTNTHTHVFLNFYPSLLRNWTHIHTKT